MWDLPSKKCCILSISMRARARVRARAYTILHGSSGPTTVGGYATSYGQRESAPWWFYVATASQCARISAAFAREREEKSKHSNETPQAHEETNGVDDGTLDAGDRIATDEGLLKSGVRRVKLCAKVGTASWKHLAEKNVPPLLSAIGWKERLTSGVFTTILTTTILWVTRSGSIWSKLLRDWRWRNFGSATVPSHDSSVVHRGFAMAYLTQPEVRPFFDREHFVA